MLQRFSFEPMKMNSWGSNTACCHAVISLVCVITFTVIHFKDSCLASCQACGAIQGNVRSQVTRIHSLSYMYVGSFVSLSDVSFIYFKRKCTFNVIMRLFSWWKRNVSFFFQDWSFKDCICQMPCYMAVKLSSAPDAGPSLIVAPSETWHWKSSDQKRWLPKIQGCIQHNVFQLSLAFIWRTL